MDRFKNISVPENEPKPSTDSALSEVNHEPGKGSLMKPFLASLFFVLAILCGYFALQTSTTVAVPAPTTQIVERYSTKNIEDIRLGERVLGNNPEVTDADRAEFGPEPTIGNSYEYYFALEKSDESIMVVGLLRPRDWIEQEATLVGEDEEGNLYVWLDMPEVGATGWAAFFGCKEPESISDGPGNIVTGSFVHLANNVIDLTIEGQEPIGCTSNHPFWSADRNAFIDAGELREGERILLLNGETKRIVQKLPRPGPEIVYNIEVFGEHVYHVAQDGVLVHNNCAPKEGDIMTYREWQKLSKNYPDLQGHHPVSQRALIDKGYNPMDSPVLIMKEGDHKATANWGNRNSHRKWDFADAIEKGLDDKVVIKVAGKKYKELQEKMFDYLGY